MATALNDMVVNGDIQPEDNPILRGNFGPVGKEVEREALEVIGTIPPELNGVLLRTGPNPVNPGLNHHWFTGDGMLHAISMENGKAATYRNRWVRTDSVEQKLGLPAAKGLRLPIQGSGNVNVIGHGGRILALSEIGLSFEMNRELDTLRIFDYEGQLASSMTAHPKIDGKTGELLFFGYDLAPPFLRYHRADSEGNLGQTVEVNLPECVMMHDFGVTATRVVFMDLPVTADFSFIAGGHSAMPFGWNDNHQARLGVLDRAASSDDSVKWIDIDPCYVFHLLNTYDDGDNIVMDVVRYERVFTAPGDTDFEKGAALVRWTIDVDEGVVESRVLSDIDQEFPRIDPRVECHPHQFGYALEVGGQHGFSDLLKHDLHAGTTQRHEIGANCAGGEPVFVPYGEAEDEGYILSVVFNGESDTSELRIIDAARFTEAPVAIVKLQTRVPFGFHGNFVVA